ncbi:hypothetical protein LXA43DRAFT_1034094 [Ganoderma leucocontextum]|nr:hypothetical protein LXA43DRAFT_1034094 [Ganoderma leucocontextum]
MGARTGRRSGSTAGPSKGKAKANSKYFGGKKDQREEPSELDVPSGGEEEEDASEAEVESLDSDALDDEDEDEEAEHSGRKRKRGAASSPKKKGASKSDSAGRGNTAAAAKGRGKAKANAKGSPKKGGGGSARKRRKTAEESEEEESELELEEGQEIVGVVVKAPKTGRVPPGQISKNTLDFLSELKKPECNDREWFKLHGTCFPNVDCASVSPFRYEEPVYRLAETEWKAFVEHFTDVLVEVDPQIPHLPPKDVIHRIYRDIRFSNDKTPYKTGFSASFSRSGRKGIFAALKPNGESLIAAGSWCPGRNELATMRSNLQHSSRRLRQMISSPEFEGLFGPAQPHPNGGRQNIFGAEDELKVAPKGVDKTHKDIDILKCRSFAVAYRFTDKQVLSPEFKEELVGVAKVMRPFVHCLNDLMTIQDGDNSNSDDEQDVEDD